MNRRTFLAANAGLLVLPKIEKSSPKRFLFMGDSITDGNRGRNEDPNHILGHGYVFSIATRLGAKYPMKGLSFVNKGISGNTVIDLEKRWDDDVLVQQPEVVTILVGINDFNKYVKTKEAAYSPQNYAEVYRALLRKTKEAYPDLMLVIMSPFLLPVGNTWGAAYHTDLPLFMEYHAASKALAAEFEATFIDLQKVFMEQGNKPDYAYWIWDGIHPTYSGHELLTQAWFKALKPKIGFLSGV